MYGYPCDVDAIAKIAQRYNLKIIYDGAHAFGCRLNDISLLHYGDLSTLSFHATKLFHTVEGGAIIAHTPEMAEKISLLKGFGHRHDDYYMAGINGKSTEFHAAMGLCMLPIVDLQIEKRREVFKWYYQRLNASELIIPLPDRKLSYNYAYFPVLFDNEQKLLRALNSLKEHDIVPRRYFYPALNTLPFVERQSCQIAEDISRKVLCLPFYADLTDEQVSQICEILIAS